MKYIIINFFNSKLNTTVWTPEPWMLWLYFHLFCSYFLHYLELTITSINHCVKSWCNLKTLISSKKIQTFKEFKTNLLSVMAKICKISMCLIIIIINPVLIWFYPRQRGWLDLSHSGSNLSHSHSPSRLILCILLLKPTLLLSFSTCDLHVFLGRTLFLFPFTSNSNAFLKTWPSSLLNTSPSHSIRLYHLNHCFLQSQHLH